MVLGLYLGRRPHSEAYTLAESFCQVRAWGWLESENIVNVLENIDIQSCVLKGQFSDRNGWEIAIRPTKKRAD